MRRSVIIIAEAGVNHNGSLELAKRLIDVAADARADIVKFQTFKTESVVTKDAAKAKYQIIADNGQDDSQYSMIKKLELDKAAHIELANHCKVRGIQFLSTAFDEDSIKLLQEFDMPVWKIPSGEITNGPYLKCIARMNKPVIMSCGMSYLGEIESAIRIMEDNGLERDMITILHCNTEYPTPMQDVNLNAMLTIKDALKVNVGYSDHTLGIEVPIAAVALGATIIEKHFTLDKSLPGPDHRASLEPEELKEMVKSIRNIELALSGNGIKGPSLSETPNIPIVRRSIYLKSDLSSGTILTSEHIIMKRPGTGISPMMVDMVIGKEIVRDLSEDHRLEWTDIR